MTTVPEGNVHCVARRRDVRRLPADHEGPVQRRRVQGALAPRGHHLGQLRAAARPGGVLLSRVAPAAVRPSAPQGELQRPHRQLRRRLRGVSRRGDGPAGGTAHPRNQRERHPGPFLPHRASTAAGRSGAPRARPWTSRSRATSSASCGGASTGTGPGSACSCPPSKRRARPGWSGPGRGRGPAASCRGGRDRGETLDTIERWYRSTGRVLDPHTAVGVKVAEELRGDTPTVCLATAHPGKFPDTAPPGANVAHERLAGLGDLPARKVVVPNDAERVARHIESVCA